MNKKPTLTDVESNKAGYGVASVASRVPTLQNLALRKIPADEFYSAPEAIRYSADPNRPLQPLQTEDRPRASVNTYYAYAGANDNVRERWLPFDDRTEYQTFASNRRPYWGYWG